MIRIHFKLITPVRYSSCNGLSENIRSYLFQMNPNTEISIQKPESKVRMIHQIRFNRENAWHKEEYFEWSEGINFIVIVPSSDIVEKHRELLENINNGITRFGNDITLGCGVLKITNIDDENGIQFVVPQKDNPSYVLFSMTYSMRDGLKITDNGNDQQAISEIGSNNIAVKANTLKGVFRNRCHKISTAYGIDSRCIDYMFGRREHNIKGCLIFHDSYFENTVTIEKQVNYHIDKFTREIICKDSKSYDIAMGDVQTSIEYLQNNDSALYRTEILFLITRVLLDLANQRCSIGGGWAQGRGFIEASRIVAKQGFITPATLFEIDFSRNKIQAGETELNLLFNAMKNQYKSKLKKE